MTAILRGSLAMVCAQIQSSPSANKMYPGCGNLSHSRADDSNSSSPSYNAVCEHYSSSLGVSGDYIVGMALLCIIVPSIVMNSFVIWSFAVRNKTIVSVDYYILTLAISDLCSPVFAYPLAMLSTFSHRWLFGETGCLVNGFLGFFFGIVDIFVLCTLSFTRYLCVCHPMAFSRLTRSKVILSLVGAIGMSLLWAITPLFGWGEYGIEPFGTSCTLKWSTPDRSYITCVFIACLVLPLLVMTSSYGSILRNTSAASRRIRKHTNDSQGGSRRGRHEMKLIKIMILMTVCFLLAWMPYAIVSMMSAYTPGLEVSGPTSIVPTLLAKTSHLSNPVIYFTMNSRYSQRTACCPVPIPILGRRGMSSAASSDSGRSPDKLLRLDLLHRVAGRRPKGVVTVMREGTRGVESAVVCCTPTMPLMANHSAPTMPLVTTHSAPTMSIVANHSAPTMPLVTTHSAPTIPLAATHSAPTMPLAATHSAPTMPLAATHSAPTIPLAATHSAPTIPLAATHSAPTMPLAATHSAPTMPLAATHSAPTMPLAATHSATTMPLLANHSAPTMPLAATHSAPTMPLATTHSAHTMPLAATHSAPTMPRVTIHSAPTIPLAATHSAPDKRCTRT